MNMNLGEDQATHTYIHTHNNHHVTFTAETTVVKMDKNTDVLLSS
jgi:hypothetical protein